MIYATYEGNLIKPRVGINAKCPYCGAMLHPRFCDTKEAHWVHPAGRGDCQESEWYEHETPWHWHWKYTFPEVEIYREYKGRPHRADAKGVEGTFIEFQHSVIYSYDLHEREKCYKKLIWVVDWKDNNRGLVLAPHMIEPEMRYTNLNRIPFYWAKPDKFWDTATCPVLIDLGNEYLYRFSKFDVYDGTALMYPKKRFIEAYGGDYEYYKIHKDLMYAKHD